MWMYQMVEAPLKEIWSDLMYGWILTLLLLLLLFHYHVHVRERCTSFIDSQLMRGKRIFFSRGAEEKKETNSLSYGTWTHDNMLATICRTKDYMYVCPFLNEIMRAEQTDKRMWLTREPKLVHCIHPNLLNWIN